MGRSQNRGGGHRFGFSRPAGIRPTLPIIVVVCDDTKTAVAYFGEIKRIVKADVTVEVVKAPCRGADPDSVVSLAVERARQIEDDGDAVWALVDLEAEQAKQDQAYQSKKKGEEGGVHIALSNPCFEVWTLAHLADTGEAFNGCKAVGERVRTEWRKAFGTEFAKKAQADYQKLMPFMDKALQRAETRHARNDPSWTEVYKVVKAILSLSAKNKLR